MHEYRPGLGQIVRLIALILAIQRRDAAFAWQQHQVQQQQQYLTPLSQAPASSPHLPSPVTLFGPSTVAAEPLRFVVFAATASFSSFKNHVIEQLECNANTLGLAAGLDSSKDTCLIGMYHSEASRRLVW